MLDNAYPFETEFNRPFNAQAGRLIGSVRTQPGMNMTVPVETK